MPTPRLLITLLAPIFACTTTPSTTTGDTSTTTESTAAGSSAGEGTQSQTTEDAPTSSTHASTTEHTTGSTGHHGSEATGGAHDETAATTDALSPVDAYCACMLEVCHDQYHATWGEEHESSEAMCVAAGTSLAYLKPHGALYNTVVRHEVHARAVVSAVISFDPGLPILGLPGGVLLEQAHAAGLRTVTEAFVDRGYTPEGTLVPRGQPGDLIDDPDVAAARVIRMVSDKVITAVDGTEVPMSAESL